MSPLGDMTPFHYTASMKNETSKNEQKIIPQFLPKGSNADTSKESAQENNARRLQALDALKYSEPWYGRYINKRYCRQYQNTPKADQRRHQAMARGDDYYHAGCGEIRPCNYRKVNR